MKIEITESELKVETGDFDLHFKVPGNVNLDLIIAAFQTMKAERERQVRGGN